MRLVAIAFPFWLFSLAGAEIDTGWKTGGGFRFRDLNLAASAEVAGFCTVSADSGLVFSNVLAKARYTTNQNILNGSGVAAGDVDGDGRPDLFFCGLDSPNALYRNVADWKFQDIAAPAGVAMTGYDCTGAAFGDLDGDGDLDLAVNTFGQGTHLFENDGRGRFKSRTVLNPGRAGMSVAFADIDADGDLDLYVTNYRVATVRDEPVSEIKGEYVNGKMVLRHYNGRPATDPEVAGRFSFGPNGRVIEHGEVDALYRNDRDFRFTHLPFDSAAFADENGKPLESLPRDWGLSCMFRDINGDSAPDLYICNDFHSPDRIWINDGGGRFRAMSHLAVRHTCMFSMGIDFADVNRDGIDDFFVADMLSRDHPHRQTRDRQPYASPSVEGRPQFSNNMLFVGRGDGTFAEVAWLSGVEASGWTWSPAFLDVDLDGYEDLLLTTGNQLDSIDLDVIDRTSELSKQRPLSRAELLNLRHHFKPLNSPNVAFRNERQLKFAERGRHWGFSSTNFSHGMAFADLDLDGDLDIAINNLNAPAAIYRNEAMARRVAVRLRGAGGNSFGIGAKIRFVGAPVSQQQEIQAGGRYLSSDEALRVFAAGDAPARVEVTWRSGRQSVVEDVRPDRVYEISEPAAAPASGAAPGVETNRGTAMLNAWFEDASQRLNHTHADEPFDDFARQPLLPIRLSQLGPGITWHDFDQDGWDDLVIPAGRGGRLAMLRNDRRGGFTNIVEPFLQRPTGRDQTTAIGIGKVVLAGSSNYEDGMTNGGLIRIVDYERKAAGESILGPEAAAGPIASADVDGDGSLDLFIGGRSIAGRFPEPATSILFWKQGDRFAAKQRFEKLGLVSGAVFSDLDQDGDPDLALACQYSPVRIFRNDAGQFVEVTRDLGLAEIKGLWNGIAAGDVDNDGRPDLIVSNWGLNTPWRATPEHPLKVHYGDLDRNGTMDVIEARFDADLQKEVPLRILKSVGPAMPFVQERIRSFAAYGSSSVQEIFGERFAAAKTVEVNTLSSMVFLNRGARFEAKALPVEAQFAPAFGVCLADLDGDGNNDVLLSQNFFAGNVETPRADAGRGLIMKGDGKGNFTPVAGQRSGVKVYGEQRGCAVADYDRDGRLDLAIAQNGAATKLYRNVLGRPGVRIVLQGPPGNPAAIGAALSLKTAETTFFREVQAGAGYWSVNSPVQIVPGGGVLTVRFRDGREVKTTLTPDLAEVRISAQGQVETQKR